MPPKKRKKRDQTADERAFLECILFFSSQKPLLFNMYAVAQVFLVSSSFALAMLVCCAACFRAAERAHGQ